MFANKRAKYYKSTASPKWCRRRRARQQLNVQLVFFILSKYYGIREPVIYVLAEFVRLGGTPPPPTPLTENQSEKKKVFFLSGKGGFPPPP